MFRPSQLIASLSALALLAGCASVETPPPAAPAAVVELSPGVAWVANDPTWGEEAEVVFAEATAYVDDVAASRPAKSWAVALDLDETVMNNVAYQIERETTGTPFTRENWHAWTQSKEATLVPGAKDFVQHVTAISAS